MWYVREKLKKADPDLFGYFERCWEIANNEWLPALDMKLDSTNSYPHIRNVESHLDQIVLGCEKLWGGRKEFFSSPIEMYVMLCSILLHDIGKSKPGDTRKDREPRHGEVSARIIAEHRAELGLPSETIANIVASVCNFHDIKPGDSEDELARLNVVLVEPYGEVRERYLAALLTIIDHLDTSELRVVPRYIKPIDEMRIVGAFRSGIIGVSLVFEGEYVEVELATENRRSAEAEGKGPEKESLDSLEFLGSVARIPGLKAVGKPDEKGYFRFKAAGLSKSRRGYVARNSLKHGARGRHLPRIFAALGSSSTIDPSLVRSIASGSVKVERKEGATGQWPDWILLAIRLGDLQQSNTALAPIVPTLHAMGVPIRAFLIKHKQHLYTQDGEETYEPVFYSEYLTRTAECMWRLSTGIFGCASFSFAILASEMRESDEGKIRLAVKRIATLMDEGRAWMEGRSGEPAPAGRGPGAIWVGEEGWRWNVRIPESGALKGCCDYARLDSVISKINALASPRIGKHA